MGHMKKSFHLSVLIVLCQSHYFYFIVAINITTSKLNEIKLEKICRNIFPNWRISEVKQIITENLSSNVQLNPQGQTQEEEKIENKPKVRNKMEEDILICEAILSMDMNSSHNTTKSNATIVIPLNVLNVASLSVLFVLIILGSYYVWKLITRKKCMCKFCRANYDVVEKLGEGGFGEIYKVSLNGSYFILKRCKTDNISEADDLILEAKHLRSLEHKNIVKYHDDFIHVEYQSGKIDPIVYVIIIMEYCEGGDLKKLIDTVYYSEKSFSKSQIVNIMIQLCEGLSYLHKKNIIHRDIKSQNIFFTKDNILRIGDFGLAKKLKQNTRNSTMTKVGTDCYMAPEVIQGEMYGKQADVWSLGCIILELCTLNFMWLYESPIGIKVLTHPEYIESIIMDIKNTDHAYFKYILKHIFVRDPNRRIKIETLLNKLKKEKRTLSISRNNSMK